MRPEPTDARIIEASLADPEGFKAVFERHYDAVRRYLQRRVGIDAGEELAAQTFLVAFDRRANYDLRRPSARPWLLGIATNLIRHHLRDQRTRFTAYARSIVGPATQQDVDEDRIEAALAGPRVATALLRLPAGDRDAFLLFALADLSYEQVAAALDIPLGTVRSRIHRARRRIREQLPDLDAIKGRMNQG